MPVQGIEQANLDRHRDLARVVTDQAGIGSVLASKVHSCNAPRSWWHP
jgi:hypothetical protein